MPHAESFYKLRGEVLSKNIYLNSLIYDFQGKEVIFPSLYNAKDVSYM